MHGDGGHRGDGGLTKDGRRRRWEEMGMEATEEMETNPNARFCKSDFVFFFFYINATWIIGCHVD